MPTVLMVAEKPMLAASIGKILSNGRADTRKGWNGACSVTEWSGNFMGQSARFKMTSTCGHVMGMDFVGKYNSWDRVDPAELFEKAPIEKKEAMAKLKMPAFLASEAKNIDYLVLWLDCDKEGENICFEVIDAVWDGIRAPPGGKKDNSIYRAHFSSITEKDLRAAMNNLGRPNHNESLSVDARQELDLRIGCAFTRFQTKYFQGKYGDLDSSCISFGPCQTPTLGFCVDRHDKIQSFKPEPYWTIQIKLSASGDLELKPEYSRGRIFDREVAQMYLERVKVAQSVEVVDCTKKESSKSRPQALNTVELMRVGSAGLGMSPQHCMQVAEHLYTQGYISYPRTETTQYPDNFDLQGTLRQQQDNKDWGDVVKDVLQKGVKRPKKGTDVGDHPPITPMRGDNEGRLSGDNARLYEYIVRHFVATVMEDCKFWVTTVYLETGGESFSLTGKSLISPGFTEILTWQKLGADENLPPLKRGDRLSLTEAKLTEKQTSPPDYLTESELISLMEKHGIGTDASIPVHINNICQRNYVQVTSSGRRLVPTQLGIVLVHGYWKIDPELVLPTMRSEVEKQLNLIALGQADFSSVKNHALEIFRQKFLYFVQSILSMDLLFEVSFTALAESGKPFCRCGKCRRYMKLIAQRPQRLHCAHCQETYSLPNVKDGILKSYGEQKCPLDDFELVYWQGPGGKIAKSFPLCPYCYSNPPFPDMKKAQGCNECTHPACRNAFSNWGVTQCPQQCLGGSGVMVLDPSSGPKWKLGCNKCTAVILVCDGATKVKVNEKVCQDCGSQEVNVEYKEGKSPFPDSLLDFKGCLFCEEILRPLVNMNHVKQVENPGGGRGRGRGRGRGGTSGRGGGRRGRGRGPRK